MFVLIISTYFIFGAYSGDFFFRFMSLLPFVLVFGLSSVIQKIYDRPKKSEGKLEEKQHEARTVYAWNVVTDKIKRVYNWLKNRK